MRVESIGDVEPATADPTPAAPTPPPPPPAPALVAAPVVSVADPGTAVSAEVPRPPTPAPAPAATPAADAAPIVSLVFADGESVALAEDDPRVGSFRAAAAAMLSDAPATGPS